MKYYLQLFLLIFLVSSCNQETKRAENLLSDAQNYYEFREYASAKLLLDSLKKTYPKELIVQREGLQLMRKVDLNEQERNLRYCDSMLVVCQLKADSLTKDFLFEKDATYDEVGKYTTKKQKIENNSGKSYIRCSVDERGDMYLASVYCGTNPINHTRIKVSSSAGEHTETENIPADGGLNYSFNNLGTTTEIVTYKRGKDGGVIQFICNRQNEMLKVEYLGGKKSYSIQISSNDKNAVAEINELATVLSDIERLKTEIQKAEKRIGYLRTKTG